MSSRTDIEQLRAEAAEEDPVLLFTISDSDGHVVRRPGEAQVEARDVMVEQVDGTVAMPRLAVRGRCRRDRRREREREQRERGSGPEPRAGPRSHVGYPQGLADGSVEHSASYVAPAGFPTVIPV